MENEGNGTNNYVTSVITTGYTTWSNTCHNKIISKEELIPERVIYNPPYTICIFPDGTKEKVRCTEDEVTFSKEIGVMACIMKKIMPRNKFKKVVDSGYTQLPKDAWE